MILDTNAISALAGKDAGVIQQLRSIRRPYTTLISLGEYQFGIAHSRHQRALQTWLDAFLTRCEVLSPTTRTLPCYIDIRSELKQAGTPIPANDLWIAALAREHQLPLLSRDSHFEKVHRLHLQRW